MYVPIFLWYEKRCEKKHSACLNRALLWGNCNASAPQIVKADRVLSAELILAFWHASRGMCFLFHQPHSRQSGGQFWLIERTVPVCHLAISTVVQELSVKWLFNNTAPFQPKDTVDHYRAITSEILVWTSEGKLMCYCDEKALIASTAAIAREGETGSIAN